MNKERRQAVIEKEAEIFAERFMPITVEDEPLLRQNKVDTRKVMVAEIMRISSLATLPVSEVKSGEIDKERILALPDNECIRCNTKEEVIELCEIIGIPFNGQIWDLYKSFTCIWVKDASWESLSHAKTTNCIVHNISDFYFASHPVEPSQPVKELSQITDEDAIEVARLMLLHSSAPCTPKPHLGRYWLDQVFAQGDKGERFNSKSLIQVIDFLRFRNYNIPNVYSK